MTVVVFTSSESYAEVEPLAAERAEVHVTEHLEGTYDTLRAGPHGDEIARYLDYRDAGCHASGWHITLEGHPARGRRFSDWAVSL